MALNDGGPAFPAPEDGVFPPQAGMSLRDWFAGMALASQYVEETDESERTARWAYQVADAMLKHRAQTGEPHAP